MLDAGLIARQRSRGGHARCSERLVQCQRAGQFLVDIVAAEVKPRLESGARPVAGVHIDLGVIALLMVAEAVGVAQGHIAEKVGIAEHTRSEEHTPELQSLMRTSYAVFCLNKKKK